MRLDLTCFASHAIDGRICFVQPRTTAIEKIYISYRKPVTYFHQRQVPSSSAWPKFPDHRNIFQDRHLANLATQTKVDVRPSHGSYARNWVLDRRKLAQRKLLLRSCTENDEYLNEGRTLKYCLAHVMYSWRLSAVTVISSVTRVIAGAAFSSVTKSTFTAIEGSDKIAGTMHPVSQS